MKAAIQLIKDKEGFEFMKNSTVGLTYNDRSVGYIEYVKFLIHKYDFIQGGFCIDEGWYDCNNQNNILK